MSWFKRIFVFGLINLAVILTISILLNLLGIRPYLDARGIDYGSLLIFCLIWGMGGAFISLAMSRMMAKWGMGVKLVDPATTDPDAQWLVTTVHNLSRAAGLQVMPEVGIYDSPEVNAFATGPTKSRSLVAVSSGLLHQMQKSEVEGVLGHEVAHIANGDMVTMTLIQGVVNAFVMFMARILAFFVANALRGNRDDRGMSNGIYFLCQFVFEIMFMILGMLVVSWFSRYREYRADAGSAQIAGRPKMIAALEALASSRNMALDPRDKPAFQSLKISNPKRSWMNIFATHPPLEQRIARLRAAA